MKKYMFVVLCVAILFTVGCGKKSSNQLKCTGTSTEGGVEMKVEVVADLDSDDKVTDASMVYNIDDKDAASEVCTALKTFESSMDGVKVSCSGNKVTIKGFAKMISEDSVAKAELIQYLEAQDMTCK